MMIKITFPDNSVKEFESGITPLQIAESISPRLAQEVLAATVDGQEWDLSRSINADAAIKLFKWDDPGKACILAFFGTLVGRGITRAVSRY